MDQTVGISIIGLPADFDGWDDLLALIRRAFAYMDGVIDPPSSAHLLSADNLAEKAKKETCFVAVENGRVVGCVFALERARDFYV
ncbi:MAG: GNAT family N-acetyltransferase, partial [Mesorhizobium sp.]